MVSETERRRPQSHWQCIDNICQGTLPYGDRRIPMETMNIALPPAMKTFVQQQVQGAGYSSVSEYVRQLIRADQQRKAREEIDRKLLEALDGGAAPPWECQGAGNAEKPRPATALQTAEFTMTVLTRARALMDLDEIGEQIGRT